MRKVVKTWVIVLSVLLGIAASPVVFVGTFLGVAMILEWV